MSNVTSIIDRLPNHGPLRHAETRRLFRYWEQLRGERAVPDKEEIDLKALGPLVPWLGLVEERVEGAGMVSPGHGLCAWRLVGSAITMLLGPGLEGQVTFADWDPFEHGTLQRMLRNVIHRHQPFVAVLRLRDGIGTLKVELMGVPVRDSVDGCTLALVSLLPLENHYAHFGPARQGELLALRVIWTTAIPGRDVRNGTGVKRPKTGYPPFTVIEGGRAF